MLSHVRQHHQHDLTNLQPWAAEGCPLGLVVLEVVGLIRNHDLESRRNPSQQKATVARRQRPFEARVGRALEQRFWRFKF